MAFQALIPIITSVLGASASANQKNQANLDNALTLANSAFTGQKAGNFDNTSDAGNMLLQGLAGSFQAAQGAKADKRLAAQQDEVNKIANERGRLENQALRAQINGGGRGGQVDFRQQLQQNPLGILGQAGSLFSLLGNGGGGGFLG